MRIHYTLQSSLDSTSSRRLQCLNGEADLDQPLSDKPRRSVGDIAQGRCADHGQELWSDYNGWSYSSLALASTFYWLASYHQDTQFIRAYATHVTDP
uniref:Uncharacterized protein n=1 Tax=Timema douglasi TaxID=61478 RepID=A0A7R8ZCZ1_TIMDO|nr:unnamed protein product [Timema douglasi]